jgi:hypothetical protein
LFRYRIKAAGLVLLVLICGSCVPEGRRAEVRPDNSARLLIGGGIVVKNIDGDQNSGINLDTFDRSWRYPDVVTLAPGPHRLTVSCEGGFLTSPPETKMNLEAKPGHCYVLGMVVYVLKDGSKKGWRAVIIDKGLHYTGGVSERPIYRLLKKKDAAGP